MMRTVMPLARRNDPDTSHEAATRAREFQARHEALIWQALKDYGPSIPPELEVYTGLESIAISRRGAGMERKGLVSMGPDKREGYRVWRAI